MYVWLSLKLIRYPIAVVSISIGLFICLKNYKSMSVKTKRQIQILVNLVFCIYVVCLPTYLSSDFKYKYNLVLGLLIILAGMLLGLIYQILNSLVSEYFFTFTIGVSTGFWIANTLEICFLYKYNHFWNKMETFYFSYPILIFICIIISWCFHYNVYNYMLTFSGSSFIVWGIEIAISNN